MLDLSGMIYVRGIPTSTKVHHSVVVLLGDLCVKSHSHKQDRSTVSLTTVTTDCTRASSSTHFFPWYACTSSAWIRSDAAGTVFVEFVLMQKVPFVVNFYLGARSTKSMVS